MQDQYTLTVTAGDAPELLELDWAHSITEWTAPHLVDLPRGISRHTVRFVAFRQGTYAIKELPLHPARRDYEALRQLEERSGPAVRPVGLVVRTGKDPTSEAAACLISRYVDYSFSYRELLSGESFGRRRVQLLDAFALLLTELHLLGCFWGDCSLSNVLYRFDAGAIDTIMVDAETSSIYPSLSNGQREHDLEIMVENVAGEMSDIAASHGLPVDAADLHMGEDISKRYRALWAELAAEERLATDEQYRVTERINRLNELGFEVEVVQVVPEADRKHLRLKAKVADRNYHRNRLRELTGIESGEDQARQILSDLRYYEMKHGQSSGPSGKALAAVQWRVEVFEPVLHQLSQQIRKEDDPVQAYCDLLYHRYMVSAELHRDIGTQVAFEDWLKHGRPGYALPTGA